MSLSAIDTRKRSPPEVVEFLEAVLERARAGELTGVLILAQDSKGLSYSVAGINDRYVVTGWLMHAIVKLNSSTIPHEPDRD
jgi:hypothetical protein